MDSNKHSDNSDIIWLRSLKNYDEYLLDIERAKLDERYNKLKRLTPDEYMPNYVRVAHPTQQVFEYNPIKMTRYGVFCAVRELYEEGVAYLILRGSLLTAGPQIEEDENRLDYVKFLSESVYEGCTVQKGNYRNEPMIATFAQFIEGTHAVFYRACLQEQLEMYVENGHFSGENMHVERISANNETYMFYVDRSPIISISSMQNVTLIDTDRRFIR